MNKTFLPFLLLIIISVNSGLQAQRPMSRADQVAILGWTDDTHYIIRKPDADKKPVTMSVDIRTGKSQIIPPSKTDRELLMESLPEGVAIGMNDIVSPDMKSAVIVKDNDLWLYIKGDKELKRLTSDASQEVNARFSPDGKRIAYTKNRDLYVYDIASAREIRLTSDASENIYNGYAAWVYYEEILGRGSRYAAFWWAPDGNSLAYLRFEETEVPVFTLNRLDEPDGVHGIIEAVHYPKPGEPNP